MRGESKFTFAVAVCQEFMLYDKTLHYSLTDFTIALYIEFKWYQTLVTKMQSLGFEEVKEARKKEPGCIQITFRQLDHGAV